MSNCKECGIKVVEMYQDYPREVDGNARHFRVRCLTRQRDALQAIVDKLPKYADTGGPIVRGMGVYMSGVQCKKLRVVRASLSTSVILEDYGSMSVHQRHLFSTPQAALEASK